MVLVVWGLIVASNRGNNVSRHGQPANVVSSDNIFGSNDASVTIVEYSDFQCPACRIYSYTIKKLLASSTVPIRFVFRHFPLSSIHPNSMNASLASESAGVQGKFKEMYKLIFDNQPEWSELSQEKAKAVFIGYAKELNLDVVKFENDMASTTLVDKINSNRIEGEKIGIDSTPTFFVNGKYIPNPKNYDEFISIVEKASK
jgi:protein-disulfide isomerase